MLFVPMMPDEWRRWKKKKAAAAQRIFQAYALPNKLIGNTFHCFSHCAQSRNACFWLIFVLNYAQHAISLTIFRISTKISPLSFAHGPQSESESEKLQQRETATATATATATVMTETDKHTGRLLLLLSDTLGSMFAAVAANSPCCVRHMRQLAVCCCCYRCYWESESKRAWEREWRVPMHVHVCACVNNSPPSKQNASAKGNFMLLGNFRIGRAFELWDVSRTIDNSCCACISV